MKDNLKDLFQERFQGHEAPVDPATWQVIEARMLTSAPATDSVNELFRERFQQHELNVDPSVWQGINTQLGHGAAAGGFLGGFGWVAAGVTAILVAGGIYFAQVDSPTPQQPRTTAVLQSEQAIDGPVAEGHSAGVPAHVVTVEAPEPAMDPVIQEVQQAPAERIPTSTTPTNVANPALPVTTRNDVAPVVPPNDTDLVNEIIAEITEKAEKEVRAEAGREAHTTPATLPDGETELAEQPDVRTIELYMPNILTPNGDGINDTYVIETDVELASALVRVASANSGQLVFSGVIGGNGTGKMSIWDGANYEPGWYIIAVEVTTGDGTLISKGEVVLLKRN